MKLFKALLSLICAAILFVVPISANAIDFSVEDTYESVFVIYSGNSLGSGFAIGKDCIVTNAHVIDNPNDVVIRSYSGDQYKAFVIGMDTKQDIAVLGVSSVEFPYLSIAEVASINIGDDIYAIGAPKSMEYTLTKGVVSAKERYIGDSKYIQIDAAINEGNSGGPLLNKSGHVIGMNTLKMTDSEGIGLAIPMDTICTCLKSFGLELDEAGNITGNIKLPDMPVSPSENYEPETNTNTLNPPESNKFSSFTSFACLVAVISILLNVVLIILLVYQKKKKVASNYDPSERTDFDIDILE